MNGDVRSYDARKSAQEFEEFTREYERQEQAKRDAALEPLTVVSAETAREKRLHDFEMGCLWSAPIDDLKKVIDSQQWQRLYWALHFRGDSPRVNQSASESMQAFAEYIASLTNRTGFKLNDDGVTRLLLLSKVEFFHGIETTQATLDVALDALLKQTAFVEGEVEYDEAWKTAVPHQQAANASTVVDFEALNLTGSQEDERRGKKAVEFLAETAAAPTAKAWLDSLAKNFGFVPTKDDLAYSVRWFRENNRSWFTPANYDAFRLHMIHIGRWSTALLSESDIRARAIERLDTNDRDVRGIVFHGSKEALLDLLQRRGVSLI